MAQLFRMPQLGSTMEEGQIVRWLKQEGDAVTKGEILLEIMTDKANMEVEASCDGVLRKILSETDALVPVLHPIAVIGAADEAIEALLAEAGIGNGTAPSLSTNVTTPEQQPVSTVGGARVTESHETVFFSPRARRVAEERGAPLTAFTGRGTGPEGRVIERDVIAWLEEQGALSAAESSRTGRRLTPLAARMVDDLGLNPLDLATGLPGSRVRSEDVLRHVETRRPVVQAPAPVPEHPFTSQPYAGMRKRIADNILKSAFGAPHVTLTLEVDMTEAGEFRARLIPEIEKTYGARLSFTDILVKAVARALGEHPRVNAALVGDELRLYNHKNIGVAVALEEGLVVPVVRMADQKSLGAVSVELKQLVERARTGKFTPDDLAGGTFSITNLGTFGIDVFDPIIVPPQAAILGVGRIADKPIVINKAVVVRSMMNLCLSFDHRILDGAPAARFLQRVKELLENPLLILV